MSKRTWDISATLEIIKDGVRSFVPVNATVSLELAMTPYQWLANAAKMMNGNVVHSKYTDVTDTKGPPCTYKAAALPPPPRAWHDGPGLVVYTSTTPTSRTSPGP